MGMRWYEHLYVGEKAGKRRFSIIQNIRSEKLQPEVYVITPASNGNNILDIHPSATLLHPYYRELDLLILGIALGHQEAMEVTGKIVDEMFRKTGKLDLERFLEEMGTVKV